MTLTFLFVFGTGGVFIIQGVLIILAFIWSFLEGFWKKYRGTNAVANLVTDESSGHEADKPNLPEALGEDEIYVISEDTIVVDAHGNIQPS